MFLGDLKRAFLQIQLESLYDCNKFCFFLRRGNRLACYRYKTLIFGFNSSPFILNYVLKHLADKYPPDACSRMMKENLFVDNLVKTSNDINFLSDLYKTAVNRFAGGDLIYVPVNQMIKISGT